MSATELAESLVGLFTLVPLLYEGPFAEAVLAEYTGGATALGGKHVREGGGGAGRRWSGNPPSSGA